MRNLLVLILFISASSQVGAQTFADFECQAAGAFMTATADCEGWTSIGGSQLVLPDGVNVTAGCGLPINGTAQWAEINPDLIGPASPVVPPSTPGTWPFVPGSVSEMQIVTTVPTFPSGMTDLAVDWFWTSGEGVNGTAGTAPCPCDDFAQIVVVDLASNTVIATLLYVDTYTPFGTAQNFCVSGLTGGVPANTFGNTPGFSETAQISIPTPFIGSQVIISVVAANQADNQFASPLFVDDFRWIDPANVFSLSVTTSGGGLGDVTLDIQSPPAAALNVLLLASATPAPGGLGAGWGFGLVPDSLFFTTLFVPVTPFNPLHYPVLQDPYGFGAITFGPGTVQAPSGTVWEATALAYHPAMGLVGQSNFVSVTW